MFVHKNIICTQRNQLTSSSIPEDPIGNHVCVGGIIGRPAQSSIGAQSVMLSFCVHTQKMVHMAQTPFRCFSGALRAPEINEKIRETKPFATLDPSKKASFGVRFGVPTACVRTQKMNIDTKNQAAAPARQEARHWRPWLWDTNPAQPSSGVRFREAAELILLCTNTKKCLICGSPIQARSAV